MLHWSWVRDRQISNGCGDANFDTPTDTISDWPNVDHDVCEAALVAADEHSQNDWLCASAATKAGFLFPRGQCQRVPVTSVSEVHIPITNLMCYYLLHSYSIGQILFVSVRVCVRLPVCPHSHGRISSSIVAKSGREVRTPRVRRGGGQHRITSSPILSSKPHCIDSNQILHNDKDH